MIESTIETEYLYSPHFTFKATKTLRYTRDGEPFTWHFLVGNVSKPCVSLFFYLSSAKKIVGSELIKTANLNNIEALYSCIENEISKDNLETYSLGQELVNTIIQYLQIHQPHITKLKINDASYIPCNRNTNEILDLLTYSIAHYGKTWYERYYKAYLPSEQRQRNYLSEIKKYTSADFKSSISWETFLNKYIMSCSDYTNDFINEHYDTLKIIYSNSNTFPIFFINLTDQIPKHKKCVFYKYWLEQFIASCVHFDRDWIIPLTIQKGGKSYLRNKSKTKKKRPGETE